MQTLKLKCIYKGGPADERRLDLYDGAISLEGLSRAIAITTHAFINGEIRTHGEAARGAKFYLLPARPGSFVIDIAIWMAGAYASGLFYDFVRHTFREVVGTAQDDVDLQNRLLKRIEPTIGELPAVLEGPLREVHRPIREHPDMTLTIARPRGEEIITFDASTNAALQSQVVDLPDLIYGNVTRYNTLSRWGKAYIDSERRVVSFVLDEGLSEHERSLITWSLHERNLNREGPISFRGSAVVSPSGKVKRYNVSKVVRVRQES